jgi:hypothetical protein
MKISSYIKNLSLFQVAGIVLLVIALIDLNQYFLLGRAFINHHFLLEYREGAFLPFVKMMEEGLVPFQKDMSPSQIYVYGIGFPIGAFLIKWLSGIDALIAGRILSALFIFLSHVILVVCLRHMKLNWSIIFGLVCLSMSNVFAYYGLFAQPNSASIFFTLAGLALPAMMHFTRKGTLLGVLLILTGVLFKQQCILALPSIMICHFVQGKFTISKIAFLTGCGFCVIGCLAIVFAIFPSYYFSTVEVFKCNPLMDENHMYEQLEYFALNNPVIWCLLALTILPNLPRIGEKIKTFAESPFLTFFTQTNLSPSFTSIFFLHTIVVFLFFIFLLGHNLGASKGVYLFHLAYPSLLIVLAGHFFSDSANNSFKVVGLACLIVAVFQDLRSTTAKRIKFTETEQSIIASNFEPYIQILRSSKNVLTTPWFSNLAYKYNHPIWDNGSTEYYHDVFYCGDKPEYAQYRDLYMAFEAELVKAIKTQSFSYIFLNESYSGHNVVRPEWVTNHYRLADLSINNQPTLPVKVYIPK